VILIVKSPIALPFAAALALFAVSAVSLTGCGQTGPLYMPHPPTKPAAQSPAKPVTPNPAPASVSSQ